MTHCRFNLLGSGVIGCVPLFFVFFKELDMTSTFVSKAAHKARQKLEQNSRTEKKEKKKTPVKEEPKTVSDKRDEQVEGNKDTEVEKKVREYIRIILLDYGIRLLI